MSQIHRHKSAIRRRGLSKPLKLGMAAGLLPEGATILDYGCGHGDDVHLLRRRGFSAVGWDPFHSPNTPLRVSEVVNLGFVLNVIERPLERVEALRRAWELAQDTLLVAALVTTDAKGGAVPYGDGVVTSIGTFQKYFDQQELENTLRHATGISPVALGMGVFALIRNPARRAQLLERRYRTGRRLDSGAVKELFRENAAALEPLLDFFHSHGRWPTGADGVAPPPRIGSLARAIRLAQVGLSTDRMEQIVAQARGDLEVLLGVLLLDRRAKLKDLDDTTRRDIRAHYRTFGAAIETAERLLFSLGQKEVLRESSRGARAGKSMPTAHYAHVSALGQLPPSLRLYELCARRFLGGHEEANVVKLRLDTPSVTYLRYPDFDRDPHPSLAWSLRVDLQSFRVAKRDYSGRLNPPILHRKEMFVDEAYGLRSKFARLTTQEERWNLYDGATGDIGTKDGWERRLRAAGVELRGHRIIVRKTS